MRLKLSLNGRVPVILDIIVRAPGQRVRNVGPSVTILLVHGDQNSFFIVAPFSLLQRWIQVVDKALPALLSLSSGQVCCNLCPLSPIDCPLLTENLIFFRCPGPLSLDNRRLCELLPFGQTINGVVIGKVVGNFVPSRCCITRLLHQFLEQFTVIGRPVDSSGGSSRSVGIGSIVVLFVVFDLHEPFETLHCCSSRNLVRNTVPVFLLIVVAVAGFHSMLLIHLDGLNEGLIFVG